MPRQPRGFRPRTCTADHVSQPDSVPVSSTRRWCTVPSELSSCAAVLTQTQNKHSEFHLMDGPVQWHCDSLVWNIFFCRENMFLHGFKHFWKRTLLKSWKQMTICCETGEGKFSKTLTGAVKFYNIVVILSLNVIMCCAMFILEEFLFNNRTFLSSSQHLFWQIYHEYVLRGKPSHTVNKGQDLCAEF